MRPATGSASRRLLLAALTGAFAASASAATPPASAPSTPPSSAARSPEDAKTTTDIRCLIVAGSLSQSDDPDLQKLGTTSLLYFWGRLEGRGAIANVNARVAEEAQKMTVADLQAQTQTCGSLVNGAGQGLQDLSAALKQQLGGRAPGK